MITAEFFIRFFDVHFPDDPGKCILFPLTRSKYEELRDLVVGFDQLLMFYTVKVFDVSLPFDPGENVLENKVFFRADELTEPLTPLLHQHELAHVKIDYLKRRVYMYLADVYGEKSYETTINFESILNP